MGKIELDTSQTISVEIMNTIFGVHENWKSTINVVEDKLLVIVLREGWKGYKICKPNISISLPKYDQLRRKLILCATEVPIVFIHSNDRSSGIKHLGYYSFVTQELGRCACLQKIKNFEEVNNILVYNSHRFDSKLEYAFAVFLGTVS